MLKGRASERKARQKSRKRSNPDPQPDQPGKSESDKRSKAATPSLPNEALAIIPVAGGIAPGARGITPAVGGMDLNTAGEGASDTLHRERASMTKEEKQAANFEKRQRRKAVKAVSTAAGAPVPVRSKVEKPRQKEKQKASKPKPSTESARPKVLETSLYMDGRIIWVNHPTLKSPNSFQVARQMLKAAKAKHGEAAPLQISHATAGGNKATVLRCPTEDVRRLFTDYHLSARLITGEITHHLQIADHKSH